MKLKEVCFARIGLAIVIGGVLVGGFSETKAMAEVDLSISMDIHSPSDFYSPLGPYGTWVNVGNYGRCWRPTRVEGDWRPYTVGHWEWTDVGWYWVSDEPWAWACYHYGSWVVDPTYGWVWIPATEWAPAWVTWREAPDYIGWAPCGPGGVTLADPFFVFVDVHHFHDRLRPRELVFNDRRLIERSRPISNFRRENRDFDGVRRHVVVNQGPGIDPIQRVTGMRFTARPVRELVQQTPVPDSFRRHEVQSNTERPHINQEPSRTGREQPRLYREAPAAQPAPTGRQEQRIYREAPRPQPAPQAPQAPAQPPALPAKPAPSVAPAVPAERPLPPTGLDKGRGEGQVRRREEPASPRAAPAPPAPVAPAAPQPPPSRERERERDGHEG